MMPSRRRLVQFVAAGVLLLALGSHVSELLDHWDNTLQTGNDVESLVVVLSLTVGAVLTAVAVAGLRRCLITRKYLPSLSGPTEATPTFSIDPTHSPPLISLRI